MPEPLISEDELGLPVINERLSSLFNRIDKESISRFAFCMFRLEYSLIAEGYFRGSNKDRDGEKPDFDNFIKEKIDKPKIMMCHESKRALNYLTKRPPKRMVRKMGSVEWVDLYRPIWMTSENVWCGRCIFQIRNNLFHGGKEMDHPADERNTLLLNCAVVLIYEYLRHDSKIINRFMEFP